MKKADLIKALTEAGITKGQAEAVLSYLPQIAADQLRAGKPFQISDFVKLSIKDKPARMGRNPATGQAIEIAAKRVVAAKALIKA